MRTARDTGRAWRENLSIMGYRNEEILLKRVQDVAARRQGFPVVYIHTGCC